jgi:hypothetical protein
MALKMAHHFLKFGMEMEQVVQASGLSEKEIHSLSENFN